MMSNPSSVQRICEAVKMGEQSWINLKIRKKPKQRLYVLSDERNTKGGRPIQSTELNKIIFTQDMISHFDRVERYIDYAARDLAW